MGSATPVRFYRKCWLSLDSFQLIEWAGSDVDDSEDDDDDDDAMAHCR